MRRRKGNDNLKKRKRRGEEKAKKKRRRGDEEDRRSFDEKRQIKRNK